MPPENKPQDPTPPSTTPTQLGTHPTLPGGQTFKTPLFGGDFTGSVTRPSPTQYEGIASYLFNNGDSLGASALLGTRPLSMERYGLNGDFGIGNDGRAKFGFDAMPQQDIYKWLTDIKFGDGSLFNADLTKTPQGNVFNAGGLWKINPEQQLSGTALVNGVEKTNDFKLNWNDSGNHVVNLGLNQSPAGAIFKGDGQATLAPGQVLTGSAELNGPTKTNDFKLNWNDSGNHVVNLGLKQSPAGAIFKGDGQATLAPGRVLTGSAELNGPTKTNDFKLNWNDNGNHLVNLGLNQSPVGTIFKGDGKATLAPGQVLTGSAELNGPTKTNDFKLNWNDNGNHLVNLGLNQSPAGAIFKGDGKATLRPGDVLNGSFELNDVEKFKHFNINGKFQDLHSFGIDVKDTKIGSIYKFDGKTTFGDGSVLAGSAEHNDVERFKDYRLGYSTLGGSKLDLGLKSVDVGSIFNADAKLMLNKKDYLTGNVLLNGVENANEFKLGANIKNNLYNFNLSTSPLGTALGAGAKFGFDDGKGSVSLEGKFGPKLSEAIGSVSYKAKDLEYSGNVKFNNEVGGFGLAEIGAKLSKGNDRFNYGIEASVNPRSGEYKVMAGISISFGGGSSRSNRSSSSGIDFAQTPQSDPVADFKQKQSLAFDKQAIDRLNPNDRALYDQAKAGVEKLNAKGANLDVDKTAMYLAALGNEKGFAKIEKVEFGNKTSDGRQNLFIFDREPTNPLVKAVPADPAIASNTSVRVSADALQRTPDVGDASKPLALAEAAPKRGAQ